MWEAESLASLISGKKLELLPIVMPAKKISNIAVNTYSRETP